jgi:hypothetical protein
VCAIFSRCFFCFLFPAAEAMLNRKPTSLDEDQEVIDICVCQHTSAYVSTRQLSRGDAQPHTSAYVSMSQHTSAYVSKSQHASAYVILAQAMRNCKPPSLDEFPPPQKKKCLCATCERVTWACFFLLFFLRGGLVKRRMLTYVLTSVCERELMKSVS